MGLLKTLTKGQKNVAKSASDSKRPTISTADEKTKDAIAKGTTGDTSVSVKKTAGTEKPATEKQKQKQAGQRHQQETACGDLIRWSGGGGISLFVKPKKIQGLKDMTISAAPETEDKDNGDEKITTLKKKGKIKITLNGILMAALGAEVEGMVNRALEAARKGDTGYLYLAGKKMFTPQFMMTKADAKDLSFTTDGKWVQCELSMELTQCSKYGGESQPTGGGNSGYKFSVTVYYSGSSGAVQSVTGYSNVSKEDAKKKAWAKVPKTALWASETPKQATAEQPGTPKTPAEKKTDESEKETIIGTITETISDAKKTSMEIYNQSKRKQDRKPELEQ